MFCPHCGKDVDDKAAVCPHCGKLIDGSKLGYGAPGPMPPRNNNYAVTGFILAFFIPFVGLILSIIGCKHAKECGGKGKGLAIAGIILSIVMFAVQVVLLIFLVGGVMSCIDDCYASLNNCTVTCIY